MISHDFNWKEVANKLLFDFMEPLLLGKSVYLKFKLMIYQ